MAENSIYAECVARGIPTDSHESDLYIPVTEETTQLLRDFGLKATYFTNQLGGGLWYDVAFQFTPFWEAKART